MTQPKPTNEPSKSTRGQADEIHQQPEGDQVMTTAQGAPMSDDQNSLRAGDRGPSL